MNQPITYEDECSKCGQRVYRQKAASHMSVNHRYILYSKGRFVTSCCGAAPVAKAVT